MIRLFFFSLYFWIWYKNISFQYFRPHRVLFKNLLSFLLQNNLLCVFLPNFSAFGRFWLSIISYLSLWGCLWGILSLKTLIWSQGHFHAWVKVWASITQKRNALFPETLNSAKIFKTCIFCACIFLFILSDFWSILFIFGQFKDKGIFWGLFGCRFMRKWKSFGFPCTSAGMCSGGGLQ